MRKRTWLMLACIVMAVTMAVGGTLAYLTDTDEAVNTVVMGNVDIEMKEYNADGSDFTDGQTLLPGGDLVKKVEVENIGSTDAYVRTWVALEQGVVAGRVLPVWEGVSATAYGSALVIGDETYDVYYVDYELKAGEKLATLAAVKMDAAADNADVAKIGSELKIPVFTQAVQKANMTGGATAALNEAFGTTHPWGAGVPEDEGAADLYIRSADELFAFAKSVNEEGNKYSGKTVALANNIDLSGKQWTPIGNTGSPEFMGTFDGNGYTISNFYVDDSSDVTASERGSGLFGWVTNATIKNLKISNANIKGNKYVGGIVGYMQSIPTCTIDNCHAINVTVTWNDIGKGWSGHTGAIVGYSNNSGSIVKNCTAAGCTVGTAKYSGPISGSTAIGGGTGNVENSQVHDTVNTEAAFDEAIKNGASTIVLGSGDFVVPASAKGKTLTIIGNGDTNVAVTKVGTGGENCDYGFDGSTVTFDNVTITTNSSTYIGYARMKGIYNNCTINGTYTLYGDSVFNNCEFNVSGDVYNVWTWGAPNATFNDCTFNSDGKALLLYGTENTKLTVNECTFNDKGGLDELKAAIEIGNDYSKSYSLVVNNTTVNGYAINDKGINTGTTLWANKNSMGTDKLNVVVDGVDVY